MTYVHKIRVRYGECDMQRVVFNANYMAYCDDAVDTWFRDALAVDGSMEGLGFDFMLKAAALSWVAPLMFGDIAELSCSVSRWGNSSFDVAVAGAADARPRFDATLTYVSVVPGENRPTAVPQRVRELLGG